MDIAIRYCSKTKFGNTRRIAEAIRGRGLRNAIHYTAW